MTHRNRRYLFAAWQDVQKLDFEHIEKVCDRFFILVPDSVRQIPFALTQRLQRLGKGVKWISTGDSNAAALPLQLAFLMGRLHQKLPTEIEFAILSDDSVFDPLVNFIFEKERRCVRVRVSKPAAETAAAEPKIETLDDSQLPKKVVSRLQIFENGTKIASPASDENQIRRTATEVVERLVRSGTRPLELATLRQYISLAGAPTSPDLVEKVISHMTSSQEIEISDREVIYHF